MNFFRNYLYYRARGFTVINAWRTARLATGGGKL